MTGSPPNVTKPAKGTIRCAIYTRKSTDEGLDREFNSLDAQRESAEAYIASQQHEGWTCLPDRYDDGGYTGGNMDRPALQRLLEETAAGKIDCIVVYKVDRLSRSLMDFSRLVELFDKHGVSFVSVTQQFNTTHSMGRLTLNILLSFAQFEREIISERTRDKMAATRRKGKWSGGHPVLGYDVVDRKLVINEAEAACVRQIFQLYLEHQSLISTIQELNRRGWTTKRWTIKKGGESGGRPFDKGNLHGLLTNVLYIGQVRYKDEVHPGEQAGIVDPVLFERVQALLQHNARTEGTTSRSQFSALLTGLLRCVPCGCSMPHTHTVKRNTRYRYYVCLHAQKQGWSACPSRSVPAAEIERFVIDQIRRYGRDTALPAEATFDPDWDSLSLCDQARLLRLLVERVDYDGRSGAISITFHPAGIKALTEELADQQKPAK
jgi:site-specific DNA recombinase